MINIQIKLEHGLTKNRNMLMKLIRLNQDQKFQIRVNSTQVEKLKLIKLNTI